MKTVAIVGASGYTGRELLSLLAGHPHLRATVVMTARPGAAPEAPAFPHEPTIDPLDLDRLDSVDGVFLCTPHGAASSIATAALQRGKRVVDLSADFRLRDPGVYHRTYGSPHPAPELLASAVYGLTEHHRAAVRSARLCANPGCYPTSILLPLLPLLQRSLIEPGTPIVADSKSGTSGAGKAPSERTHFGAVHENFCAYGVGNHRHVPEIHQEAGTDRIVFTPHLLPVFRGMLSTLYVQPARGSSAEALRACLQERYAGEPFVTVYPKGQPELCCVQRTNHCHIAVAQSGPLVVLTSAIDNLGKGASGQALQNMNLMLGLPETAGLLPAAAASAIPPAAMPTAAVGTHAHP
ncbi:MAG: N-acetyl-gamma-glutamyl-phosphate reductase [Planctomycetes bacterium]|nr:N-acetyl-gamma-glutamyl-phosphate reductase [Planctomycetota bacterium]